MKEIKKLTDREHVLLRPEIYIGSINLQKEKKYIFENGKFIKQEIEYSPGLIKLIDETIDNAVDEAIRLNFKKGNKIKIDIDKKSFKVVDNGGGIPIKKDKDGEYYPKIAFGNLRSGSNFEDNNRITIGKNGFGIALVNIFSLYFKAISQDGNKKMICEWRNGADPNFYKEKITKSSKTGVEIYVEPNFKLFNVEGFTETDFKIIETRLVMLKLSYPQLNIYINGEKLKISDFSL